VAGASTHVQAPPQFIQVPEIADRSPLRNLGEEPSVDAKLAERLDRIEERLASVERLLRLQLDAMREELRLGRDSMGSVIASVEARQVSAIERLRSDVMGQISGDGGSPSDGGLQERRAEATMGLYAGVARLESALAQVTNPILLPGEAYAPPVEFLPEALAWENWKDVGERAFSLADAFSTQRLCFTDPTRQELAAFVTTLRGSLTRAIYPNLVPDPTPEQLDALRSALGALAAELPRVRRALETEFRSLSSAGEPTGTRTDRPN